MVKSKEEAPPYFGTALVQVRDGPKVAPEMARVLGETAAAADKTAQDYALLRARLRELQIEHAKLRWQLNKDNTEFVQELNRVYREESDVFAKSVTEVDRVEREIVTVERAIDCLNEEFRSSDPTAIKVVVELDMARYSDIAKGLEDKQGPQAVGDLNRQIKDFVTDSIKSVDVAVKRTFWKSTGDGAILVFGNPDQASRFAEALHKTANGYNRGKRPHLERRHFRVGVATGPVLLEMEPEAAGDVEAAEMAGMTISNAVRLEAACRTGEVLIDEATWSLLPPDQQAMYGDRETIRGKRKELIPAHRRAVVAPAPWEKA